MRKIIKSLLIFTTSFLVANLTTWLIFGELYFVAILIGSIISTLFITNIQQTKTNNQPPLV